VERRPEIVNLRPDLQLGSNGNSEIENFQNQTLRPIIKFQHQLSLLLLKQSKFNTNLDRSNPIEFHSNLKKFMSNDLGFRYTLIGMICGLMTKVELEFYNQHKSEITRRLIGIQLKRYLDSSSEIK